MLASFFVLLTNSVLQPADPHASSRAALLAGVKEVARPGIPGLVAPLTPNAFSVIEASEGPVAVAATFGRGRVLVLGHTGYLDFGVTTGDTQRFQTNAVRWLQSPREPERLALNLPGVAQRLSAVGLPTRNVAQLPARLGPNVLVIASAHDGALRVNPDEVRAGTSFLIASTGWGWEQITGRAIRELPVQAGLNAVGVAILDGMTDSGAPFAVNGTQRYTQDAQTLWGEILAGRADAKAGGVVQGVLGSVATDSGLAKAVAAESARRGLVTVGPGRPLPAKNVLERILVRYQSATALDQANPSAALFPGAVPTDAPRGQRRVTLALNRTQWIGTGLYAPPGQRLTVTLPESQVGRGFRLQIGAHTDRLWHLNNWTRFPDITVNVPLDGAVTSVVAPFGGTIYLVNPRAENVNVSFSVTGAVEAPHFVLGQTTPEQWLARRAAPGPWTDLEGQNVVITVPSSAVRALGDPTELMQFWDQMTNLCADLAQVTRNRTMKERIVADEQISAGYMHAGYPIMTWLDVVPMVVNLEKMKAEGSWGHYHEMGHNHQSDLWTFDGTVEVTVNLFTLYVYDNLNGFRPKERAFTDADCLARWERFMASGPSHEKWKNDPFLALTMYAQLQNAFGWDTYKAVFRAYQQMPANERPRTEQQKRDQWMVMFSRQTGKNLGPFFEAWRVPVTAEAKAKIADLPTWMPAGMTNR